MKIALREADNCYHVFLDVGANIGVHCRFLFEPKKYPDATISRDIFDHHFGADRDNRDFCCFEFEPNRKHFETLHNKSIAYGRLGWRYFVKNVGASDFDGKQTFYHKGDEYANEWGFSDRQGKDSASNVTQTVDMIHLASWIDKNLFAREIPTSPFGNYSHGPRVVMKMDIEGGEYTVLPDLLTSGVLCKLNFIFGEFHPMDGDKHFQDSFFSMLHSARRCNGTFQIQDDESYLHDGMPLP